MSIFKTLSPGDVTNTTTNLHESIPITGTIISGTYADANIKNYAHGMFQSVYDYPYLSSSANHIFDITLGYSPNSGLANSSNTQHTKKTNIYNQMAQLLAGYDATGSILEFDTDGDYSAGGTKMKECVFINFSRLLTKDEIKKGSFSAEVGGTTVADASGSTSYKVNSPAGEYGLLYQGNTVIGHIYYQAGVLALSGTVLNGSQTAQAFLTGSTIQTAIDDFRSSIQNITFVNTTELNSTVYFCRANSREFNYSSNPTYLSGSKIVVKNNSTDIPISYVTTVGLYSPDNQLMAVAKLSEPLRKDPSNEITLRVRLDY